MCCSCSLHSFGTSSAPPAFPLTLLRSAEVKLPARNPPEDGLGWGGDSLRLGGSWSWRTFRKVLVPSQGSLLSFAGCHGSTRRKFSWKTDSGVSPPRLCPPSTCQVLDLEGTGGGPMSNQIFSVVFGGFFLLFCLCFEGK